MIVQILDPIANPLSVSDKETLQSITWILRQLDYLPSVERKRLRELLSSLLKATKSKRTVTQLERAALESMRISPSVTRLVRVLYKEARK